MPKCKSHRRGRALAAAAAMGAALTACANASEPVPLPAEQDRAALQMALDDEYKAEATYRAVLDKFGEDVRPFTNIIRAEQHHAQMAAAQMQRLGMAVPGNPYLGTIAAPESLLAACQEGRDAEIANIALYDEILPNVRDPQVRAILGQLQAASRDRHLPAFERCIARGGTMGGGGGRGPGGGMGRGGGNGGGGQGGGHQARAAVVRVRDGDRGVDDQRAREPDHLIARSGRGGAIALASMTP